MGNGNDNNYLKRNVQKGSAMRDLLSKTLTALSGPVSMQLLNKQRITI